MMLTKLFRFVKKYWQIIVGLILAVLIYFKFVKKKDPDSTTEDNVKDDVNSFQAAGIKPSYAQSYYDELAKQIFEKFRYYRYITKGSYSELARYISQMRNYQDFLQLKKAFGERKDLMTTYNLTSFIIERTDSAAQIYYNTFIARLLEAAKKQGVKFNA